MNFVRKAWKKITAAVVAATAAVLAFLGLNADAQSSPVVDRLSWAAPTQFVDGSAIPAGTITGYRIAYGPTSGTFPTTVDVGPILQHNLTRAESYGNRCYRVAALVGAINGEWSAEACKNVQAPARAPTALSVQ